MQRCFYFYRRTFFSIEMFVVCCLLKYWILCSRRLLLIQLATLLLTSTFTNSLIDNHNTILSRVKTIFSTNIQYIIPYFVKICYFITGGFKCRKCQRTRAMLDQIESEDLYNYPTLSVFVHDRRTVSIYKCWLKSCNSIIIIEFRVISQRKVFSLYSPIEESWQKRPSYYLPHTACIQTCMSC